MSYPSKALQAEWTKKLKDSGFEDAESSNGDLKDFHGSRLFRSHLPYVNLAAKEEYYRLASQFTYEYKEFKSSLVRLIWELHSQGHTERDIATSLNGKLKKSQVHTTINNLAKIMLKFYRRNDDQE